MQEKDLNTIVGAPSGAPKFIPSRYMWLSVYPSYYYDEDGLGLKINEYRTGCYMISDDKDNEMYFVNGFLSKRSTTGTSLFLSSCATIDVARKT